MRNFAPFSSPSSTRDWPRAGPSTSTSTSSRNTQRANVLRMADPLRTARRTPAAGRKFPNSASADPAKHAVVQQADDQPVGQRGGRRWPASPPAPRSSLDAPTLERRERQRDLTADRRAASPRSAARPARDCQPPAGRPAAIGRRSGRPAPDPSPAAAGTRRRSSCACASAETRAKKSTYCRATMAVVRASAPRRAAAPMACRRCGIGQRHRPLDEVLEGAADRACWPPARWTDR